jgi:hypothetical protein
LSSGVLPLHISSLSLFLFLSLSFSSLHFLSIWSHLKIRKNTSLIYMISYIRRSLDFITLKIT